MFGKLPAMMAGIVAMGLLAVAVPASAAPSTGAAPASAVARDVSVHLDRVAPAATPAAGSAAPSTLAATAAANPYVVVVQNQSAEPIDAKIYWVQSGVTGALNTGGRVNSGTEFAFRLGGTNGCTVMQAYILEIWYQGELAASTTIVEPSASDGYQCADFWGVSFS